MAIDIFSIEEHKISRDLSGYITYVYAAGGFGKTTLGAQMPKPLLLAFERGYNAIAGVKPQDMNTWRDMKTVLKQLEDPRAKEIYNTIVVDTVDKASVACEKYICGKLGIENIGDGGWATNGWAKVKREWEETFNKLAMMGYAILFISHDKETEFTRKDGTTYTQIRPSCSKAYNEIIRDMSDLQAYGRIDNGQRSLVFRSQDGTIECKSRFKYIDSEIPFSYEALVEALNNAIDKEGQRAGGEQYVTNERENIKDAEKLDFSAMVQEFNELVAKIQEATGSSFGTTWAPRIVAITDEYLGKNNKVADLTPSQVEQLALVLDELKDQVGKGL